MPWYKLFLLSIYLLLISFHVDCQSLSKENVNKIFNEKVSELDVRYKIDGFITYKAGNLRMKKNTEFPIFIELLEGRWYQFSVVGDPEATKIEMKLGLEGVGEIITDKFKPTKTNEYWTTFSFICPRSGKYLMTIFQKANKKDLQGHVAILQKQRKTEQGVYTFK